MLLKTGLPHAKGIQSGANHDSPYQVVGLPGTRSTWDMESFLWFCTYLSHRRTCNKMKCSRGDAPLRDREPSEEGISHVAKCASARRAPVVPQRATGASMKQVLAVGPAPKPWHLCFMAAVEMSCLSSRCGCREDKFMNVPLGDPALPRQPPSLLPRSALGPRPPALFLSKGLHGSLN